MRDLQAAHDWWAEHRSREQAISWYRGVLAAIRSLANKPERFAKAIESELLSWEVRELHFGLGGKPTHRVLFGVQNADVVIYRVRHLAQDYLTGDDFNQP